ncbi:hypothetical protein BU25DRAFT_67713 [Macroventuria anomochaeta]|uniref:Uncharacterized protein n=1 Tax=Macroventuria anomochaeta TaxID=301207 RepID=A0ACB6RYF7_9PLEO|nr:uncharacterized protein BU25DRAFT_67713 [Macroventuria anomochaeta]KAF2627015.1 hypothetical protein BU25DRAFT_67713 [Macroventuria anomochaeta]
MKQCIAKICVSEGHADSVHGEAGTNCKAVLVNHHSLLYAGMRIVAAIALTIAFSPSSFHMKKNYALVAKLIDAPEDPDIGRDLGEARRIIGNLAAAAKIEDFVKSVPRMYRRDRRFDKDKIATVARRIRSQALKHFSHIPRGFHIHADYIVAASVQQAMAQYKMQISMQEICNVMRLIYDGRDANEAAHWDDARDLHASTKVELVVASGTSKADWAENKIRCFAAATDWRKLVGAARDRRKRKAKKALEAEKEAGGIHAATAALRSP